MKGYVDFRVCGLSAAGGGLKGILCEEDHEANGGKWHKLHVETKHGQSPIQVRGALLMAIRNVLSDRLEALPIGQDTVRIQSREGNEGRIVFVGCQVGREAGLFLGYRQLPCCSAYRSSSGARAHGTGEPSIDVPGWLCLLYLPSLSRLRSEAPT